VYLFASQSSNQNVSNQSGLNGSANNTNGTNNTVSTTIIIQNGAFNPNNINVKTGTNVQWIDQDNTQHQIISDSGEFQSPILNNGGVFNFYFAKSGVFGYHCGIHPTETGTITVTP
jgi:plastocyanin